MVAKGSNIKSESDLDAMRPACRLARRILDEVCDWVKPGVTTREVDEYAGRLIASHGAKSAFLGYRDYPCHVCISPNEQVVHGIANETILEYGDIVSIDVGVVFGGFIGDNARTIAVGGCDSDREFLLGVTETALRRGIDQARAGHRVVDVSRAIQQYVEGQGLSVVKEFVGHGVGRKLHEEPQIPNFVDGKKSEVLYPGMTLAIEPMVNAGAPKIRILSDKWTVVTQDGRPSAHFEHTVLVTTGDPEIMTVNE